jgi:cytoskeletal protein RodZ
MSRGPVGENVPLPLVIVVVVVLIIAVVWRGRTSRRLTIEQSVDRYRRTLSAVHDAASRSRTGEGGSPPAAPMTSRSRRSPIWAAPAGSRWRVALLAAMGVATIAAAAAVIVANRGNEPHRAAAPTTTRPPATHPTTTTRPAPTTTVPIVTASDGSGTAFTVSKSPYSLVIQTNTGPCWIDARDATGTALYTGTLLQGQSQSIAGVVTVQLGNPGAVTLSIDGTPVPFVQVGGSPVTLHFQTRA